MAISLDLAQRFKKITGNRARRHSRSSADPHHRRHHRAFLIISLSAIIVQGFMIFLFLFEPSLPYRIKQTPAVPVESEDFLRMLETLASGDVHRHSRVEVLDNGEQFYEAELAAIRAATANINIEAYIFEKGEVTRRFIEALTERARAGVKVKLVIDAIGSFASWDSYFKDLRAAGGRVQWYHYIRWFTLPRINNRTHRELIIIDGQVGFIGGAGFADHWLKQKGKNPRWRDTMFRVEGDAVSDLQSTFAENWIESSGEVLIDQDYFPKSETDGQSVTMVVNSSPSAGRSTRARITFQTLLAAARKSIYITTPYFLPDESARQEMVRAVRERGVELKIITPGDHADHLLTRRSSRRLYGDLLEAGAQISEYQPSMIHAKTMVIDGVWSVVGSTNFDNRSFGLNDEVNLIAYDPPLAARLQQDFGRDWSASRPVSYEQWKHRPLLERCQENLGWLLQRQQ